MVVAEESYMSSLFWKIEKKNIKGLLSVFHNFRELMSICHVKHKGVSHFVGQIEEVSHEIESQKGSCPR